jgi:hypothetical protein
MNEKGILFNTEMVQAIQEDRKDITRRPIKKDITNRFDVDVDGTVTSYIDQATGDILNPVILAPYAIGDILWVRETWCKLYDLDNNDQIIEGTQHYYYKANNMLPPYTHILKNDGTYTENWIWRPSIHMPRSAARLFLSVLSVRIERVQDITESDALREGFNLRAEFLQWWNGQYGEEKDWCWAIEFKKV